MRNFVSHDRLLSVLSYDAESGNFTWRGKPSLRARDMTGELAGGLAQGYVLISIDGVRYKAHRLAWLYVTGEWPPHEIDHINGKRGDNRFDNLRPATHAKNLRNQKRRTDNSSGFKGVYWNTAARKWCSQIRVSGKNHCLGYFDSKEVAYAANCKAAAHMHGEFARTS
jgi:hypothetical protein